MTVGCTRCTLTEAKQRMDRVWDDVFDYANAADVTLAVDPRPGARRAS